MDFDIKDYLEKLECVKKSRRSKYERPDPNDLIWWENMFKDLEEKFQLPNYKKKRILKQYYSGATLDDLKDIGIDMQDEDVDAEKDEKKPSMVIDDTRQKELDKLGIFKKVDIEQKEKENPYYNFISKSTRDAQIWRPREKLALDSLSLIEKAAGITDDIAEDFHEYLESLGGQKKVSIDKTIILELFELNAKLPASTSICRNGKDLMFVSQAIADLAKQPKFSERACIKRDIAIDLGLGIMGKRRKNIAFVKLLPQHLRMKALQEDIRQHWLGTYVRHDELATMMKAFDDITELQSVRSFCKWLMFRPEIPKAKYLKDKNLFDWKVLNRKIISAYQILEDEDLDDTGSLMRMKSQSIDYNKKMPIGPSFKKN